MKYGGYLFLRTISMSDRQWGSFRSLTWGPGAGGRAPGPGPASAAAAEPAGSPRSAATAQVRRPAPGPVPASSSRGGPRASEVRLRAERGGHGGLLRQERNLASNLHCGRAGECGESRPPRAALSVQLRAGPRSLGASGSGPELLLSFPARGARGHAGAGAGGPGKLEGGWWRKSEEAPDWASLELSPSVESCGCGLGPSPVRLG